MRFPPFSRVVLAALLILLHPAAVAAADAVLAGTVAAPDGTPIAHASVVVSGAVTRTAQTDARGRFSLGSLPSGTYVLTAAAAGYEPLLRRGIALHAGTGETADVVLSRSASSLTSIGSVRTRDGEPASTSAAPVREYAAARFAAQGYTSVAEILAERALSATIVRSAGGSPAAPAVVALRGPDPTETLVDIDGHPVNSGGTGTFDVSLLDPADLAGIQVVYGIAPSSLVGPNTIDGAINARTLEPTQAPHELLRQSVGSHGAAASTLQATGTHDRFSYAFSMHRLHDGGEVNGRTVVAPDGSAAIVGSAIDATTAIANMRYALGRDGFAGVSLRDQRSVRDLSAALTPIDGVSDGAADPVRALATDFAGSSAQTHNAAYGVDLQFALGGRGPDGTPRATALLRHQTAYALQSVTGSARGTADTLNDDRDLISDDTLQIDRPLRNGMLTLKLALRSERLDVLGGNGPAVQDQAKRRRPLDAVPSQNALTTLAQTQRSAVLRYLVEPARNVRLTLAAYASRFTSFGSSVDPRLGVVWTPGARTAVRFSAGTTFQSPQLPELYVGPALPLPDADGYYNVGNPRLKADHATDYDLGAEHAFGQQARTRAGLDLYRTNLRTPAQRYIPSADCRPGSVSPAPPPQACMSYPINAGAAVYQGAEAYLDRRIGADTVVHAGYGIDSAAVTAVSPAFAGGSIVAGEQILGVPLHKATLSIDRSPARGLGYSISAVYEGENNELHRPAFATLRAGLSWRTPAFDVGLYGTNLTGVYADRFTLRGGGVPYAGADGPIATDAYALPGRAFTVVITRRW